jgi:hypothetical protein
MSRAPLSITLRIKAPGRGTAWLAVLSAALGPACAADLGATVASVVEQAVGTSPSRISKGVATVTPELTTARTRLAPSEAAPLTPEGRPMSELAEMNYRLWLSAGRADVGVGVGTVGYVQPRPDGRSDGTVGLVGSSPTLSVGLRYRVGTESSVYADASGARGLGTDPTLGYLNTKVGMEWKPARSRFGFDRGTFGMRFDSGYHLSLRARHGGLGVYLRGQF